MEATLRVPGRGQNRTAGSFDVARDFLIQRESTFVWPSGARRLRQNEKSPVLSFENTGLRDGQRGN